MYELLLKACLFLCVVSLFGKVLMVKGFSKVFVENWFNHVGRTCCCHLNIFCLKVFKDLFHCGLKFNGELLSLWLELKISILHF